MEPWTTMPKETEMAMAEEETDQGEEGTRDWELPRCLNENEPSSASAVASSYRKEKRKASKKERRKQKRKEAAEKELREDESRLNDPDEQLRIQLEEEREKERLERERREFEEKVRLFLEALDRTKAQEEEEEQRRVKIEEEEQKLKENEVGREIEATDVDEWEYAEEGPPEIIWQGNEIIVKKNKIRVKKIDADEQRRKVDPNRPTSNPLPPQSDAFADFKNLSMVSAEQLLENVAQQTPNFGTEQDKAHCPFHLKTGACRFGPRCSRVHFYPDKFCTLLIKNMYNGPGLAWEQDEGLENFCSKLMEVHPHALALVGVERFPQSYTEEEVEHSYEEFYEDVHTEFLKFGEIVNFKVCRNVSYHLRGNVYVHYKSLDSAVLAYLSTNGRYFAGKQFVGLTRWKVAICGEYMKSNLKTCSRGTACNFIHCFRNPGGDYEWANWDKPAPKYWVKRMAALFGYSDEFVYNNWIEQESPGQKRNSSKTLTADADKYRSRRSLSKEIKGSNRNPRDHHMEDGFRRTSYQKRHVSDDTKRPEALDDRQYETDADGYQDSARKSSRCGHKKRLESHGCREIHMSGIQDTVFDADPSDRGIEGDTYRKHPKKISRQQKVLSGTVNDSDYHKEKSNSTDSRRDFSHENRDSVSSEDQWYSRSRTSDSDSTGDLSDGILENRHVQKRKSHLKSREHGCDKYHRRGCERAKSNLHTGQKHTSSGKRDHSSRKTRRADNPEEQTEDTDTRGRSEPEKVHTIEHHKHTRKPHGESGSHDQIVNEYSKESRSRKRSKSSNLDIMA